MSNILGLGHDLIEIERIEESFHRFKDQLIKRILTPKEQQICFAHAKPISFLAGRFSAKEALSKALGTGIGKHLGWHDLEILPDKLGKPHVTLSPEADAHWNHPQLLISITHSKTHASSVALLLSDMPPPKDKH